MLHVIGTQLFMDALLAPGPNPARANQMNLYSRLLGSWEVDVIDIDADGSRRTSKGEWHFAWVLEGRAIQDVFIVPARDIRRSDQPLQGNRYGTTIRVYYPEEDVWRIAWFNAATGVTNRLVARRQGDEIMQEGTDADDSLIRWVFSDVTDESFRWRGEVSTDEGKSWYVAVEFFARRATQFVNA